MEEIFEKNLLFLIPFYIFSHESRFKIYEKSGEALKRLCQEYAEIRRRLEELCKAGRIDEYTKCTIVDMANRVLEHIAAKYDRVKEGVKNVMGGRILEHEAKNILSRGIETGRMEMINGMLENGYSYEDISRMTKVAVDVLKQAAKNWKQEAR